MLNAISRRRLSDLNLIVALATILSISATGFFLRENTILAYTDAESHLLIAKKVAIWGFAQLGQVWLPLTHLLILPWINIDPLLQSGLAGSFLSMACYVGTAVFIYKSALILTKHRHASILGTLVFLTNPNVLYMQATPMTELPLFLFLAAAVYFLLVWSQDTLNFPYLLGAGIALSLASLVRYEAWFILLVVTGLVVVLMIKDGLHRPEIEDYTLAYGFLAFVPGILGWGIWNWILVGNPLAFQYGEYAKPSLWVVDGEKNVGNLSNSLLTYLYAMVHTLGWPVLFGALIGLGFLLYRQRLNPVTLVLGSLCSILVFFVVVLYLGQRPLHVQEIQGDLYNLRFGLIMILPVSLLASYLASLGQTRSLLMTLAIGAATVMLFDEGIITRVEPIVASALPERTLQHQASQWFQNHYDSGEILLESYGNEQFLFDSGTKLDQFITEGSYLVWDQSLASPEQYVTWIVVRGNGSDKDKLWTKLVSTGRISDTFQLVFQNDRMLIFNRANLPIGETTDDSSG